MISRNIQNEIMVLSHLQNLCHKFDAYYICKFSNSVKYLRKELKNESLKKYIKIESKKIKELENKFLSNKLTAHFSAQLTLNKEKIIALYYQAIKIYDNKSIVRLAYIDSDFIKSSHKVNKFNCLLEYIIDTEKDEEYNNCFEKTIDINIDINEGEENVIKNCLEGYKTFKNNSIEYDNSIDYDNMGKSNEKKKVSHCHKPSYLYISGVIGLGNKDDFLIKLIWEGFYCEYAVCRLKNKKVSIIQSIYSDFEKYKIISISPLSEKRFLVYLDNGINIFCLHQKYNIYYSEIFISKYDNPDIKRIYEANNIIIICSSIGKVGNDYIRPPTYKIRTSIQNLDSNKKILFLKCEMIICNEEKSGQKENSYKISYNINFSNGIILKNKYFIFMLDNNLLVLSLLTFEIIKNYSLIFYYDDDFLIYKDFQIEKWDEINDNEFILNVNGNITLFELIEDNLEIGLKILAYYYFPNIDYIQKVDDNNNYCRILNDKIEFY